jgi:PhoH-like ATPase
LNNRENGFLPGGIGEKINPYMNGFFDNLSVIKNNPQNEARVSKLEAKEKYSIEPLGYIRGRSLINAAFIIDEAQNLTPKEAKAIVTRAGEGTKIIFTGDITQIDDPYLDERSNG